MLLSIATTHRPATDLGFLLHKNPSNVHETTLSFGKAIVFYPEASDQQCTACLCVEVDPIQLVRGRHGGGRTEHAVFDHYVNDRPYAASSFLSVAIARSLREALSGKSKQRQALADTPIPLEATVTPLPCKGGDQVVRRLFEPLGYTVELEGAPLDRSFPAWGDSPYRKLTLRARIRLAELLSHLYVLVPVLDNQKHYWVGTDEVEKLVEKGRAWLGDHPARKLIANRYLRKRAFAEDALTLLEQTAGISDDDPPSDNETEEALETPIRLSDVRYDAVVRTLVAEGVRRVCDLGCGEGKLLRRLMSERQLEKIVGVDVSPAALQRASQRLKLDRLAPRQRDRLELLHGSIVYEDQRLEGFDGALLIEVIEHIDPERLDAVERVVFGKMRPNVVLVSTPNVEYNATFTNLPSGQLRHPDHRFEWTRSAFADWSAEICERQGYTVRFEGIGEEHPAYGPPTQMAIFTS